MILAAVYAITAGAAVLAAGFILGWDTDTVTGFFAGAFTQSSLFGMYGDSKGFALAYTMTYFVGTICSILFARYLMPVLLRVDLVKETKKKSESLSSEDSSENTVPDIVQVRAFTVNGGGRFVGQTVRAVEAAVDGLAEVEMVYRDGCEISPDNNAVLKSGDVLTVVGDLEALHRLEDMDLTEIAQARYLQIKQSDALVVLATEVGDEIYAELSSHGILVSEVRCDGKRIRKPKNIPLKRSDVLGICGPENAVKQAVAKLGYIKNNGITTDIPFFALAIMFGLIIGSVSFMIAGKKIALGTGFGALLVGLISGWAYDRYPKYGHITDSTRWFIKSIGLNLFIAVTGLTSSLSAGDLISTRNLALMGMGILAAIIARIPVMFFGKYVLKLDTVDLVGGMCGSGTNTPALNAVTEYTGSSLYALCFAPGYAVGNVALILVGIILGYF